MLAVYFGLGLAGSSSTYPGPGFIWYVVALSFFSSVVGNAEDPRGLWREYTTVKRHEGYRDGGTSRLSCEVALHVLLVRVRVWRCLEVCEYVRAFKTTPKGGPTGDLVLVGI